MAENQFYLIQLILIGFEAILELLFLQIRQKAGDCTAPLVGMILGHGISLLNLYLWYLPAEFMLFSMLYSLFGGFSTFFCR